MPLTTTMHRPDQGLRNCQWPGDAFLHPVGPDTWVDQANTCWTGVELLFAAQLYSAGLHENAEEIIRNVDVRHRRWGMYWDHQEFGGHYFRPMSALAIPNAFLGLSYDGETLCIATARPQPFGRWCVLLPGAFGTFHHTPEGCHLALASGSVKISTLVLPTAGQATPVAGGNFAAEIIDHATVLRFATPFHLTPETPLGTLRS